MKKIKNLFPEDVGNLFSAKLFYKGLRELKKESEKKEFKISIKNKKSKNQLLNKLEEIPDEGMGPKEIITRSIKSFFDKIPNWRSSKNQYNICAPANAISVALLALAQEYNIHNINSDFSGNGLMAEKVISNMMAGLIGKDIKKVKGLFSFGGTASNMYAMKIALNKAIPNIGKIGISKNVYILITEDCHFSHKTVADWLGIGTDKLIVVKADEEGRSIINDAEKKLNKIISEGKIVAGFILNGGPFYNFTIDDIKGFINLRKKLIKKHDLHYVPHIHVDSVIGWVWLMFRDYDFKKNSLKIDKEALQKIKEQTKRISKIKLADSWGIDFHKGIGGAPTPSGLFISNNSKDLFLLSKKLRGICKTHHLGGYWSSDDPSDITLETSRSASSALSALGSLLSLGKNGFRRLLKNQMECTIHLRKNVSKESPFISANDYSLGFNTMIILKPKGLFGKKNISWENIKESIEENDSLLEELNNSLKSFFKWCLDKDPLGCSFSSSFYKTKKGKTLSGLKYCIVSPNINKKGINREILKLKNRYQEYVKEKNEK
jgi:L-2,4-diaminobutyrate decarboxylase